MGFFGGSKKNEKAKAQSAGAQGVVGAHHVDPESQYQNLPVATPVPNPPPTTGSYQAPQPVPPPVVQDKPIHGAAPSSQQQAKPMYGAPQPPQGIYDPSYSMNSNAAYDPSQSMSLNKQQRQQQDRIMHKTQVFGTGDVTFRRRPMQMNACPSCQQPSRTRIRTFPNLWTWAMVIVILLLFWPVCWIPLILDMAKQTDHYCVVCESKVGEVKPLQDCCERTRE